MDAMEYGVRDFAELLMEICVIGVICGYIPNGRKICVICGQVPGELESGLDQPDYGASCFRIRIASGGRRREREWSNPWAGIGSESTPPALPSPLPP